MGMMTARVITTIYVRISLGGRSIVVMTLAVIMLRPWRSSYVRISLGGRSIVVMTLAVIMLRPWRSSCFAPGGHHASPLAVIMLRQNMKLTH